MGFSIKKFFKDSNDEASTEPNEDDFYSVGKDGAIEDADIMGNKVILLEPRAYSESQQIADYLKKRNSVVVNLKRVTSMQKIGVGIYLCAPKNVNVQGKITEETDNKKEETDSEDIDW